MDQLWVAEGYFHHFVGSFVSAGRANVTCPDGQVSNSDAKINMGAWQRSTASVLPVSNNISQLSTLSPITQEEFVVKLISYRTYAI